MKKNIIKFFIFILFLVCTFVNIDAKVDKQNTDIISFVDSLSNMLCPTIKEELKVKPFEEFVKLQIDTTKFDRECLNNFHKFYNYFYSSDNLEEKYLNYRYMKGSDGKGLDLPFILDIINLKGIYTIIQGGKFNYRKWAVIYKDYYDLMIKKSDSISTLDSIYGIYIPKDIEEAARICISELSREDIKRILQYQNDDDCFWSEFELAGKIIRKKFLLFLRPRLTKYFEERINTANPFVISGLIIVHIRNNLNNNNFDYKIFYKDIRDFDDLSNGIPIKGQKIINMDDRE